MEPTLAFLLALLLLLQCQRPSGICDASDRAEAGKLPQQSLSKVTQEPLHRDQLTLKLMLNLKQQQVHRKKKLRRKLKLKLKLKLKVRVRVTVRVKVRVRVK